MTIRRNVTVLLLICTLIGFPLISLTATAISADEGTPLRKAIEGLNKELQELQVEREEIEEKLEVVEGKSSKLSGELRRINYQIDQLNISVRSNKLTAEKLGYEVTSLHGDIFDTEKKIEQSKETIGKLFVQLQQRENENLLVIFLKYKSLAESISEVQSIMTLGNTLINNVNQMRGLQIKLARKAKEVENKKHGIEIEQQALINRQYIVKDLKGEKQYLLVQTKNEESIYQSKLEELLKLQRQISKEMGEVESQLRKNINPDLLPIPRPGVLSWPVDGGRLSQEYGRTPFAIQNYGSQHHNGIDIAASIGTKIFAAESGTVINVANQDSYRVCRGGAYGKLIVVKHDNGLSTLYAHLSRYVVSIGDRVKLGDVIGYMGHSGWSTGSHLHFTIFASHTLIPAHPGFPEGTRASRVCGPMPVGGDLDPSKYIEMPT